MLKRTGIHLIIIRECENGDSAFKKGIFLYKRNDFLGAYKCFRRSTHPEALNIIGSMYFYGSGKMPTCLRTAICHWKKATIHGSKTALYNIKTMCNLGIYIPSLVIEEYLARFHEQEQKFIEEHRLCEVVFLDKHR